jgi:hypothetical protein
MKKVESIKELLANLVFCKNCVYNSDNDHRPEKNDDCLHDPTITYGYDYNYWESKSKSKNKKSIKNKNNNCQSYEKQRPIKYYRCHCGGGGEAIKICDTCGREIPIQNINLL